MVQQLELKRSNGIQNKFYIGVLFALITVAFNSDWNDSRVIWWGIVALFVFTYFVVQSQSVRFDKNYTLWVGAFFCLCFVSILWAKSSSLVIEVIKTMVIHLMILLLIRSSIRTNKDIECVLKIVLAASVVNAVYLLLGNYEMLTGLSSDSTEIADRLGTEGSWNANSIGMMASIAALVLVYLMKKSRRRWVKCLYIALAAFMVFVAFLTGSRKAFLIVLIGISMYLFLDSKGKRIRTTFVILILAAVLYYLMMEVPFFYSILGWRMEAFLSQFTGKGELDSSAVLRERFVDAALKVFSDYPIFGCGIDCFRVINKTITGRAYYAHNNYVEILADLGIFGAISFYSGYVYLGINMWRKRNESGIASILLTLLAIMLVMQYACVTYNSFLFEMLTMLIFAYVSINKKTISSGGDKA